MNPAPNFLPILAIKIVRTPHATVVCTFFLRFLATTRIHTFSHVRESINLLFSDCCSQHLFDDFDDFSGVVSSDEREDEVLEENDVSEERVE